MKQNRIRLKPIKIKKQYFYVGLYFQLTQLPYQVLLTPKLEKRKPTRKYGTIFETSCWENQVWTNVPHPAKFYFISNISCSVQGSRNRHIIITINITIRQGLDLERPVST